MTYTVFKKRVEALGYQVHFGEYGMVDVTTLSGKWLATVFSDIVYNFHLWLANDSKRWGNETKRVFLTKFVVQLAGTKIKNRGKLPIKEVA